MDPRIYQIFSLLEAFAAGDFSKKIEISDQTDEIEACIQGLNMLGDELGSRDISGAAADPIGTKDRLENIINNSLRENLRTALNEIFLTEGSSALKLLQILPGRVVSDKSNFDRSIPKTSDRELQILRGIAEGKTNKEIAAELYLGERTVETYRKSLIQKFGAKNTAELINLAHQFRFLP